MSPSSTRGSAFTKAITTLPDVILLPMLWLCVTTTITIIGGVFAPWTVIPATLVLSALTWRWRPTAFVARFDWQGTLIAIAIAVGWFLLNLPYASQYLVVDRDPGFLTLEGVWLRHHGSGTIPIGSAAEVANAVSGAMPDASNFGYTASGDAIYVQGAKALSGLLAVGGWIGGTTLLLAANLIIGAVALIAFYGFARRVVGPTWALLGIVALGASMPFVAFTRSAYTEPLVLALTFAGLTFMWTALSTHRWQHFVAGGALLGAGGLVRIDGASIIVGFAAGMALVAWAGVGRRNRRNLRKAFLLSVGASLVTLLIGLLDLLLDSPAYVSDLRSQIVLLFSTMFIAIIVGLLITTERPWQRLRSWYDRNRRVIANVAAALVALVAIVLISRPLWLVTHGGSLPLIAGMQAAEGLPIDQTRDYDELSVAWISWYYGWIMVVLGFAGMAMALRHALRSRDPRLMLLVTVVAAASLLYLVKVSIAPDQVWAMRRLLPVTVPGLIVFALWLARAAWKWGRRRRTAQRNAVRIVAVVAAVSVAAFPFATWGNMWTVVEHGGRLNEANVVCSRLPSDRVVFVAEEPSYFPTLRTYCDAEVIWFDAPPTTDQLAQVASLWRGDDPVTIVSNTAALIPWAAGEPETPTRTETITRWPNTLSRIPHDGRAFSSTFYIGTIQDDGTVSPVTPVE